MKYLDNKFGQAKAAKVNEEAPREIANVTALQGPTSFGDQKNTGATNFQTGATAFGSTVQGDNPYRKEMRDEYGWKMTDDQYGQMQEQDATFDSAIGTYRSQANQNINQYKEEGTQKIAGYETDYAKQKKTHDAAISAAQKQLSAARSTLGKTPTARSLVENWYNSAEKVNMAIHDGKTIQYTYRVPKETFLDFFSGAGAAYKYDVTPDGTGVAINVHQSGRTRGQELHELGISMTNIDSLEKSFRESPQYADTYNRAASAWHTANNQLNSAESTFNSSRAAGDSALQGFQTNISKAKNDMAHQITLAETNRDNQIGLKEAERSGVYDAAETSYKKRTAAAKSAYGYLSQMSQKYDRG